MINKQAEGHVYQTTTTQGVLYDNLPIPSTIRNIVRIIIELVFLSIMNHVDFW